MIDRLVLVLDAATAGLTVARREGMCELVERDGVTLPCRYVGGKDLKPVVTDTAGTLTYWRLTGPIVSTPGSGAGSIPEQRVTVSLRMVALCQREAMCPDPTSVLAGVQNNVQENTLAVRKALGLNGASVDSVSVDVDSARVWAQEVKGSGLRLPTDRMMVAMDVRLTLRSRPGCLPSCVEPVVVDVEQLNID